MKNLKKTVVALLCLMMACFVLTGCEKTSSQIEAESQKAIQAASLEDVRNYTQKSFADTMKNATYEDFEQYESAGQVLVSLPFDNDWGYRWKQFTDLHGKVTEANVDIVERTAEGYTGRIILTGEDEELMTLTITYDRGLRPISTAIGAYSNDDEETLASKMAVAGSNTITGLIVVFFILVFLSVLIYCFKFIGNIGQVKPEKKDAPKAAPAPAPVVKAAPATEEIDLAKNQELVAVIAAAIAASEQGNPSGYVVRSIRRIKTNKWR